MRADDDTAAIPARDIAANRRMFEVGRRADNQCATPACRIVGQQGVANHGPSADCIQPAAGSGCHRPGNLRFINRDGSIAGDSTTVLGAVGHDTHDGHAEISRRRRRVVDSATVPGRAGIAHIHAIECQISGIEQCAAGAHCKAVAQGEILDDGAALGCHRQHAIDLFGIDDGRVAAAAEDVDLRIADHGRIQIQVAIELPAGRGARTHQLVDPCRHMDGHHAEA